jgi:hypothetical protein
MLEQPGTALDTNESRNRVQQDFLRLDAIVYQENVRVAGPSICSFLPTTSFPLTHP